MLVPQLTRRRDSHAVQALVEVDRGLLHHRGCEAGQKHSARLPSKVCPGAPLTLRPARRSAARVRKLARTVNGGGCGASLSHGENWVEKHSTKEALATSTGLPWVLGGEKCWHAAHSQC